MTSRRTATLGLAAGAATLLSSCGTILYPDRINQKRRGDVDFMIVGLDAVGLIFFLVPGIIAFAVDFGTGAIYFPEERDRHNREQTIFDKMESQTRLDQPAIERIASRRAGTTIDLDQKNVQAMHLNTIRDFDRAYAKLSTKALPTAT